MLATGVSYHLQVGHKGTFTISQTYKVSGGQIWLFIGTKKTVTNLDTLSINMVLNNGWILIRRVLHDLED